MLAGPPPTPATGIAARWFPDKERATVSGLFDSASKFGGAIAMPLIVWMIYTFDWRLTFLIIGGVGILWVIARYFIYAENRKNTNASVLQKCVLFAMAKTTSRRQTVLPMKWYKLLRYRNIWAMCIGFYHQLYLLFFIARHLPGKRKRYGFY